MKNLITLFSFACFLSSYMLSASTNSNGSEVSNSKVSNNDSNATKEVPANYKKRSPIYDYSEVNLNNVDTIPGYETKKEKLKISGTIYHSDGVTPAKDVLLYINQTDEFGNFDLKRDEHKKRYVYHRAWVKTGADGKYTFYTFIPGTVPRSGEFKHIHPVIKEPGQAEYQMNAFVFDNDPLMTKRCSKKLTDNMLKLEKKEDMYVTTRDIVLVENNASNQ